MKKSVLDLHMFMCRSPEESILNTSVRIAEIHRLLRPENSYSKPADETSVAMKLKMQLSTNKIWPRQADCSSFNEYYKKYIEIVDGSEGFISYPDPTSTIMGGIGPCSVNNKYAEKAAKYAVEEHNKMTGANITLKNIVNANSQFGKRLVFYLTLETLDGDQTVFKEAKVHQYMDGSHEVDIFRNAIYYYKIKEMQQSWILPEALESILSKTVDVESMFKPRPSPVASTTQAAAEKLKTQSSTNNFHKFGDDLLKAMNKFLHPEKCGETENAIDDNKCVKNAEKNLKMQLSTNEMRPYDKSIEIVDAGSSKLESNLGGNADSSTKKSAGRSQKHAFFNAHKYENWLKNRYHPTNLLQTFGRRKMHAQMNARDFLSELTRGIVDLSPCATFYSSKSCQTGEPNSNDKAADGGGKRRKHEFSAALRAHPVSCLPIQVHRDIGLASALVRKLDFEKGIKDNVLCNINYHREFNRGSMFQVLVVKCLPTERVLYGTQLLDTLLTYLWRIHGVNYYGMIESDVPEGFRHVRPDGKDHGETSESGDEWLHKLHSFWYKRLIDHWVPIRKRGPIRKRFKRMRSKLLTHPWKPMIMKQKLDAAAIEAFYRYKCVKKIYDENNGWMFGCVADGCTELFHCAEYAHEHLKLKHPEVEVKLTSLLHEKVYLHNYMSDPDARGGSWWDP